METEKTRKNTKNGQKTTFFWGVKKGPKLTIFDKIYEKLEKIMKKFYKTHTGK
jgi:hypothetical protein